VRAFGQRELYTSSTAIYAFCLVVLLRQWSFASLFVLLNCLVSVTIYCVAFNFVDLYEVFFQMVTWDSCLV
jgi:hypothetical protein